MKNNQIFVNLPVKELKRSRAFFDALGYEFNPQFSNDQAACMVVSDAIFVMLLEHPFFQGFTKKPIADAHQSTEVLLCLACTSAAEVDALVVKALAAGGRAQNARQDHGFMVSHGFEDLDGHVWELVWMNPEAPPPHA